MREENSHCVKTRREFFCAAQRFVGLSAVDPVKSVA